MNKNYEQLPDVIDTNTLREFLGIGKTKAYELVRNKQIKSRRIGNQYKILKKDVLDFLETSRY